MKIPSVTFQYMPLTAAMEFAFQDEPGYWKKYWAEDFKPQTENLA
jgi:tagatose-1,6-bisphosphate aldolase non-catalytic subunit AgaZ/GatZ